MMGTGALGPATSLDNACQADLSTVPFPDFDAGFEADEEELFAQIKRPRVRYDVEVVTKLVVYSGRSCQDPFESSLPRLRFG